MSLESENPETVQSMSTKNHAHPRMARENRTIRAMIRIYCLAHHDAGGGLCPVCEELQNYAEARLALCPFQEDKTTCANCPVHCYKQSMRETIREVMKYSGPRMTLRHPVLATFHFLDGLRKPRRVKK